MLLFSGDPLSVTSIGRVRRRSTATLVYDRSKDVRVEAPARGRRARRTPRPRGAERRRPARRRATSTTSPKRRRRRTIGEKDESKKRRGRGRRTRATRTGRAGRSPRCGPVVAPAAPLAAGAARAAPAPERRPARDAVARQGRHDPPRSRTSACSRAAHDARARRPHRRGRQRTIDVPPGARVVDYGPDAVIVPGLVAADSTYGRGSPSRAHGRSRACARSTASIPYARTSFDARGGRHDAPTCAPARGRLIAGQGAVVKLARRRRASARILERERGDPRRDRRRRARRAGLLGAARSPRRSTSAWASSEPQLPRSTMGAIVALRELLDASRARGERLGRVRARRRRRELRELMTRATPWRCRRRTEAEIRALLAFARESSLPLVIDGADEAAATRARDRRRRRRRSIVDVAVRPQRARARPRQGPRRALAALSTSPRALAAAGVRVAIAPPGDLRARDLRFAAAVASRGGLDERRGALRAITLSPAEILGVADRVGSLAPGKDADFVVLQRASARDDLERRSRPGSTATWLRAERARRQEGRRAPRRAVARGRARGRRAPRRRRRGAAARGRS